MKIKNIHIRNFRGTDNLELNFAGPGNRPLNLALLAGPNGCGKTSVLEACIMGLHLDYLLEKDPSANPVQDIRKGCNDYEISVTVRHQGEDFHFTRTSSLNPDTSLLPNIRQRTEYFSSWRSPKLVGSVFVTAGKEKQLEKYRQQNRLEILKQYLVNLKTRQLYEASDKKNSEKKPDIFQKLILGDF